MRKPLLCGSLRYVPLATVRCRQIPDHGIDIKSIERGDAPYGEGRFPQLFEDVDEHNEEEGAEDDLYDIRQIIGHADPQHGSVLSQREAYPLPDRLSMIGDDCVHAMMLLTIFMLRLFAVYAGDNLLHRRVGDG